MWQNSVTRLATHFHYMMSWQNRYGEGRPEIVVKASIFTQIKTDLMIKFSLSILFKWTTDFILWNGSMALYITVTANYHRCQTGILNMPVFKKFWRANLTVHLATNWKRCFQYHKYLLSSSISQMNKMKLHIKVTQKLNYNKFKIQ